MITSSLSRTEGRADFLDNEKEQQMRESWDLAPADALQHYLAVIRRYPLLSPDEEHELAVRYKEYSDIEAAYRLVTANLRLVVLIAKEYQRQARSQLLDLIQEGNCGLMEAVRKFDPYRGIRFPSYAVWWMRAYIIRYIMDNWRMLKIGTTQAQRKLFFNLQREKTRLEAEGFSPEPKLLAQRLGVKVEEVVEMQQRLATPDLSLDAPIDEEEGSATLLDFVADTRTTPEKEVAAHEYRQLIKKKLAAFARTLKGKERVIFTTRLLAEHPLTLQEIADQYGITRERVRQIETRVKQKLKDYLRREFKDFDALEVGFVDEQEGKPS
jgi:RNA polymerase sigma-32 factor